MDINELSYEELAELTGLSIDELVEMEEELDEEAEEDYDWIDEAVGNAFCDWHGFCGGPSCPNFFKCQGGN